jgi:hypothetical protein
MRKDHNHRHRLKHGHPFQVLRTTLSLGSTTSWYWSAPPSDRVIAAAASTAAGATTKTPADLPAAAVEQNKTPPVEPNEAQPAAAAVEPNEMSPGPTSSVEPDKAPAVELNDVQPSAAAVEPNNISPAPAPTVEPDKAPAELPAAADEQNAAPPRTSAGAVLRGSDIPD